MAHSILSLQHHSSLRLPSSLSIRWTTPKICSGRQVWRSTAVAATRLALLLRHRCELDVRVTPDWAPRLPHRTVQPTSERLHRSLVAVQRALLELTFWRARIWMLSPFVLPSSLGAQAATQVPHPPRQPVTLSTPATILWLLSSPSLPLPLTWSHSVKPSLQKLSVMATPSEPPSAANCSLTCVYT